MVVNTILLDFILPNPHEDDGKPPDALKVVETVLEKHKLSTIHRAPIDGSSTMAIMEGPQGATATVRIHPQGMVTVTLEYYVTKGQSPLFSTKELQKLRDEIADSLGSSNSRLLPPVQRGCRVDPYLTTSDERLLQYDFDELLFEQQTAFQKVQIFHSTNFGNALVLDGLINLAESDLIYTETLMQRGKLDYTDKNVLILGGGDGALLHELLQENPGCVTMVEIDDVVMKSCRTHMRTVCGESMDQYVGPHHEIIVDDALKVMDQYEKEGKFFDVIIGDLTDIPISSTPQDELWVFFRNIISKAFKILGPNGVYLMHVSELLNIELQVAGIGSFVCDHGNGISSKQALSMFEDELDKMDPPVVHSKSLAYVPSFMEQWVFYQIKKREEIKS
ncbi:unnamed protein product [Notodromas monacha]|uniref:PABS domain-containing protein n=1 Tax=Notodromas monacha TaxID=399045 RepID=A0A7R9BF72_9CRUS|nr:unnamed protein product [Notodromas monacha]CAG0912995.1 unnamed protein product [Notodromas monacha]